MVELRIPGFDPLRFEHLVLDYNGTLARDGELIPGVAERIERLKDDLSIHVLTGDTFGKARATLAAVPCRLTVLEPLGQAEAKQSYVEALDPARTVCIGNGRNDGRMLEIAGLSIAVVQEEGAAADAVLAADVLARGITEALDLLLHPLRLVATLRS